MTKYLVDTNQKRPIRMFYAAQSEASLAYKNIFETARQKIGMQTLYVPAKQTDQPTGQHTIFGFIDGDMIKRYVPDFKECIFYISGTYSMVEAMQLTLAELGGDRKNIKIDFFLGYA